MGEPGDDIVSLPVPPPPRPAARREAIEAALRKFDGIEDAPLRPARRPRWSFANLNRRPAGALVAATLIAVIAIPAMQVALRNDPQSEVAENREPVPVSPDSPAAITASESPPVATDEPVGGAVAEPPAEAPAAPSALADELTAFAPEAREEKADIAAPAPMVAPTAPPMAAPAPPPPPPPPPPSPPVSRRAPAEQEAQAEAADAASGIVVTGSRVRSSNLESAAPVTVIDAPRDFLSRLQGAIAANDRRAVIRMIGFPLRVSFDGDRRTYRTARDVERDYDRIFTPEIRQSALALRPNALMVRDGGRLRGNGRIWFGCGRTICSSAENIGIREISP
ncbi:MAG TPA: hypothetical protein VFO12_01830 [Sphingomicrobium sp.]|nr:hypothetical protein [Sphingomicrobium sp.]